MKNTISFFHHDLEFLLLPEKAVFLFSSKTLVLSDLHLGKINHFRKAGIPVPAKAQEANMELLATLVMRIKPRRVIFLGDLFHSHYNSAWESFGNWMSAFSHIQFDLVAGNHDILSDHQYHKYGIGLYQEIKITDQIVLRHIPEENNSKNILFQICGHLHPAVMLRGKGRRTEKFPCFWFSEHSMIMPAFGEFTGVHCITPKKNDRIFFIADEKVIDASLLNDPS